MPTNHFISLAEAIEMTTYFRAEKENILANDCKNQNILLKCETFDRQAIDDLLATEGCRKIRIYFGMLQSKQVRAILVAVNENDEDILPVTGTETEDAKIVEEGLPCPEICPPPSDLN